MQTLLAGKVMVLQFFCVGLVPVSAQERGAGPITSNSPDRVVAALDLPCSGLRPESAENAAFQSIGNVIGQFRRDMARAGLSVPVLIDYGELVGREGISDVNGIRLRPLTVAPGTHTWRDVLQLVPLFCTDCDVRLSFLPRKRSILLTSHEAAIAEESHITRICDVGDLLRQFEAEYAEDKEGGRPAQVDPLGRNAGTAAYETLAGMIQSQVGDPHSYWFDIDGEGGRISRYGDSLLITQDEMTHRRIAALLEALRHPRSVIPQVAGGATIGAPRVSPPGLITREKLESILDAPCPAMRIDSSDGNPPNAEQFIRALEQAMQDATGIPVQVFPEWMELELDGISDLQQLTIRPFATDAGRMTFRDVMDFAAVHCFGNDPRLAFLPVERHILLTSEAAAESEAHHETIVYDVSAILRTLGSQKGPALQQLQYALIPEFDGELTDGADPMVLLIELIEDHGSPNARWFHIDGEGGRLDFQGRTIAIRQSYLAQRNIHRLLLTIHQLAP